MDIIYNGFQTLPLCSRLLPIALRHQAACRVQLSLQLASCCCTIGQKPLTTLGSRQGQIAKLI